jgi:hypothetical protein
VPLRMRGVENCVIPIESTAQAADGLYLRRIGRGSSIQLLGDKMVGVPKLPGSLVRHYAEGAAAGRSEIRGQDWLPDDQNAQLRIGAAGKKLSGCEGPPQTRCSSWGEQKDDARPICRGIKRVLEFAETGC